MKTELFTSLEFSEHLVPAMNIEASRTYLAREGLWEDREGMIHLTSRGASFLNEIDPVSLWLYTLLIPTLSESVR